MSKIVVFGPGPRFKGGIANFTVSLAKALYDEGADVTIVSWSQQYPAIIPRDFIDRTSKIDFFEGRKIDVHYLTNFNNPFSWTETANFIASLNPDKVIFQWAIAIQGLTVGRIARRLKEKVPASELIFDVHNIVQKESGSLDKKLTRYALKKADTYIMHGQVTIDEFASFLPEIKFKVSENGQRINGAKTILKLYHPVYDMFKPKVDFDIAQEKASLKLNKHVFLFFGFIRKYKGLHYAIEAFSKIANKYPDSSLLIVGESFWNTVDTTKWSVKIKQKIFAAAKFVFIRNASNEKEYRPFELIEKFGLTDQVIIVNKFIPNEDVHRYFQVSDAVVNFYEYATPSGVESIAYNFNKPILATRVGHFANAIIDGKNGYLAEAEDVESMAAVLEKQITHPVPTENVMKIANQLSWKNYARVILFEQKK
jgi:glycosyltransferase involved in cell wall biosynthesis